MSMKPKGVTVDINSGGVQVIARVGQIFRALDEEPLGLTMSQLASQLTLPRSTIHRLVNALVAEGLLMNASIAGRVLIGSEFVRIATGSRSELRDHVTPLMRRLNEMIGETVDCGVLEGDQVRVIHVIETQHQLRAVSNIGATFPLYCTAKGKGILALLDDSTIQRLIPKTFEVPTNGLVRTRDELMDEIAAIRDSGLAYDNEEHASGIRTIAIGAQDPYGSVFAISIPVPAQRFTRLESQIAEALLDVRAELTTVFSPLGSASN
jgi:DNA-binding IclR family transcriptional regulator